MTPRRLAVIGHPITHSLSPVMHTAALRALGLGDRYMYEALDVTPDALASFVARLREGELLGANVTLPHKRAVMALCDVVEPAARAIGAVNTLVREPGGTIVGLNTDAPGLARALEEEHAGLPGAHVLVLGAGGAARAAVVAAKEAGAAWIAVAARRRLEAELLSRELGADVGVALSRAALERLAPGVTLVLQATSATLDAAAGEALAREVPWRALPSAAVVCDLVYRPRRTAVLAAAEAAQLRTIDGMGMLAHQGALALSRWLGVEVDARVMRAALNAALG